ncbi:tapetum determinant 1 [Actinidia rufa]|uniref:Tapetum determinant 1 n=1 Tax=Actinidia rufa TaxID=165716 RepID=A0A7J0GB57_9ERIC|nr:tapetum determinant 1 [Actinidia rufa]
MDSCFYFLVLHLVTSGSTLHLCRARVLKPQFLFLTLNPMAVSIIKAAHRFGYGDICGCNTHDCVSYRSALWQSFTGSESSRVRGKQQRLSLLSASQAPPSRSGSGTGQNMGRQVFEIRHRDKPGADGAAPERHTDVHGGDNERVHKRLRHQRHPPEMRLVQLRPPHQPPHLQASPLQRLPRQQRQSPPQRPHHLLPVRQHLQLPSLRLLRHLLTYVILLTRTYAIKQSKAIL